MRSALMIVSAAISTLLAGCSASRASRAQGTFSDTDFAQLRFLEGRWKGTAPGGAPFFEAYEFPEPTQLRSRRFADESFSESTDESRVVLEAGQVLSKWGNFTWRARAIADGRVCFEPVNAPSSFCWIRVGEAQVDVVQQWTDEAGKPQTYTVALERI